jgi:hypothetical protein
VTVNIESKFVASVVRFRKKRKARPNATDTALASKPVGFDTGLAKTFDSRRRQTQRNGKNE